MAVGYERAEDSHQQFSSENLRVPVTLSDDEFALLYIYLDREHSIDWDPIPIGQTTKLGRKLRGRIQEIACEQDFPVSEDEEAPDHHWGVQTGLGVARIIVVPTPGHDRARTSAHRIT